MPNSRVQAVLSCLILLCATAVSAKTHLKDAIRQFEGGKLEDRMRLIPALGHSQD